MCNCICMPVILVFINLKQPCNEREAVGEVLFQPVNVNGLLTAVLGWNHFILHLITNYLYNLVDYSM